MEWILIAASILMVGDRPEMRCKIANETLATCENLTMICRIRLVEPITEEDSFICLQKVEMKGADGRVIGLHTQSPTDEYLRKRQRRGWF